MKSPAFRSRGLCSSMKSGLLASTFLATRRWMGLARSGNSEQSNAGASNAQSRTSRGRPSRRVSGLFWAASILSAFVTNSAFAFKFIIGGGDTKYWPEEGYVNWHIGGDLVVGRGGDGTLVVGAGGVVSGVNVLSIGDDPGSAGNVR